MNQLTKKLLIFLLIVFMTLSLCGCKNEDKRVITNIDEKQEERKESKNKEEKGLSVIIDNVTYKGYKGPVQGEIKYQEGRPAEENSRIYKASGDIESPYHVNLVVTRDFGHTKIFGKNVGLVKDEVGMEVMFRNLDIQTAYGGGFVNAINGLESKFTFYTGAEREKMDWFYWVNGILAPVGIAEYRPQPDDVIWWDYHDWSTSMFIPAVIGSYPQPFKNGFGGKNPGTVIMYTEDFEQEAQKLKASLIDKGVKEVEITPYNQSVLGKIKKYYILLGKWKDLSNDSKLLQKINTKNKLIGFYVKFHEDKLYSLNFKGKVIKVYDEKAGVIHAHSSGMGSTKPIWLVTGIDDEGVNMALEILLKRPEEIYQHFGAVITKEGIENVPYLD
ncbi:DUF4430 domain-containing protein [Paramaledivibacter caminithermalis]|jgi:hypothetical protein|uniref:Transcobalamin-like C-terminal domain-containing protein n=1 Tax=Paramaledivibacter caminithermalis (strain DSM 15212 / CIP 107654 / DViRD3) TaxID=1121301 RepID=A0A1M6MWA2_PARC5|nr:DUF4430 domain-containing protein [Paramaledivibacter caminithermalis]SHJ87712.1 protein of unknown function [Paramaledivibacter caminithermalis DSM 15212]